MTEATSNSTNLLMIIGIILLVVIIMARWGQNLAPYYHQMRLRLTHAWAAGGAPPAGAPAPTAVLHWYDRVPIYWLSLIGTVALIALLILGLLGMLPFLPELVLLIILVGGIMLAFRKPVLGSIIVGIAAFALWIGAENFFAAGQRIGKSIAAKIQGQIETGALPTSNPIMVSQFLCQDDRDPMCIKTLNILGGEERLLLVPPLYQPCVQPGEKVFLDEVKSTPGTRYVRSATGQNEEVYFFFVRAGMHCAKES